MMETDFDRLESRVARAAERLRELSGDRKRLEREVRSLRGRLRRAAGPHDAQQEDSVPRDEIVESLQQALSALRES